MRQIDPTRTIARLVGLDLDVMGFFVFVNLLQSVGRGHNKADLKMFFRGGGNYLKLERAINQCVAVGLIKKDGEQLNIPEGILLGGVRKQIGEATRRRVFARDGYRCVYCGSSDSNDLVCDHVIPVASGGDNSFDNLATACNGCNYAKGHSSVEDWKARRQQRGR